MSQRDDNGVMWFVRINFGVLGVGPWSTKRVLTVLLYCGDQRSLDKDAGELGLG